MLRPLNGGLSVDLLPTLFGVRWSVVAESEEEGTQGFETPAYLATYSLYEHEAAAESVWLHLSER